MSRIWIVVRINYIETIPIPLWCSVITLSQAATTFLHSHCWQYTQALLIGAYWMRRGMHLLLIITLLSLRRQIVFPVARWAVLLCMSAHLPPISSGSACEWGAEAGTWHGHRLDQMELIVSSSRTRGNSVAFACFVFSISESTHLKTKALDVQFCSKMCFKKKGTVTCMLWYFLFRNLMMTHGVIFSWYFGPDIATPQRKCSTKCPPKGKIEAFIDEKLVRDHALVQCCSES